MKSKILLVLLILVTAFTRFVHLNWDQGFGFHPDENNLWGASRQVKLFSKIDPNFYAYGGFPIYLYSLVQEKADARGISALLQSGIVVLLFYTGKLIGGKVVGIFSALVGALSAGLIQAAHFLTVESLIGFFGLLIVFSLIKYSKTRHHQWLLLASLSLGLGIGTKISFAVFALPFFSIVLRSDLWFPKVRPLEALKATLLLIISLVLSVLVFLLTNPYILTRWEAIRGTLTYESNVATGRQMVFYTKQFIDTIPGLFQIVHIFPSITSWLFVPLFIIGLILLIRSIFHHRFSTTIFHHQSSIVVLLAIFSALLSFIPFWAKWTRYVVQVLPILIIPAAIALSALWRKNRIGRAFSLLFLLSLLPSFSQQLSVYLSPDTRLATANWAETNIPKNAKIFTEAMDLGILPFNSVHGNKTTLMNFYELDEDKTGKKQQELDALIKNSDYFISVSRRVYGNSLAHPDRFPKSAAFYKSLFDGSLGYQKVYDSSSAIYDSSPEETFSVFDHPTVMIFKKINGK